MSPKESCLFISLPLSCFQFKVEHTFWPCDFTKMVLKWRCKGVFSRSKKENTHNCFSYDGDLTQDLTGWGQLIVIPGDFYRLHATVVKSSCLVQKLICDVSLGILKSTNIIKLTSIKKLVLTQREVILKSWLMGQSTQITPQKIPQNSHLYLVVSSQTGCLGFICHGFGISVSGISSIQWR